MKYFFILTFFLFTAMSLPANRLVFDMPEAHSRHLALLKLMNSSHSRQDYHAMEDICRQGLALQTTDSLWTYNLACALSLQGRKDEALTALRNSVTLGFQDLDFIKADKDLQNLHETGGYREVLDGLQKILSSDNDTNTTARLIIALSPDADSTVMQAETNTVWSFNTGLFHTFISMQFPDAANAETNTGSHNPNILYVNRDNNSSIPDLKAFPGILKLAYCDEMKARQQHIGAPNTLFQDNITGYMIPVIGNSSMGFMSSAYWRCQPRGLFNDPEQINRQIVLFLANQLFCYPTYSDYNIDTGDLFPANTPYYLAVSGSTKSEQIYTEAIAGAISALPPETREYLTANGLLMPTIQQMIRYCQKAVTSREKYMSGIAHPAAFLPDQLDSERFLNNARKLTTNNIPPLVAIRVEESSGMSPELDMPTCVYTENLFDTPLSVSKVFRAFPYKRKYNVKTLCKDKNAKIHCVLLQGSPERLSVGRNTEDPDDWMIELSYHTPFMTKVAEDKSIISSRVDIGFFAETESSISLPAILSVYFPGNEIRTYDGNKRLVSIDYRRNTALYTDPLLCYSRNWKDEFTHDKEGRITGWTRIRPRKKERFTAYGDLAIEFDDLGRATKARRITYTKRYIGDLGREGGSIPSLAQVDDNLELNYTYASDEDFIGRPDGKIMHRLAPPDQFSE